MKQTLPSCYREFHCTAAACQDSCCIGWEIDIDASSLARYRALPGAFGDRLRSHICMDGTPHFALQKERCPFLNQTGLCDIITTLGESALCEICARHPRFCSWFGGHMEIGLSLCCEAVGTLLFSHPEPITFVTTEIDEPDDPDPFDHALFSTLFAVRDKIFAILQDRTKPLSTRLCRMLALGDAVQDAMEPFDPARIAHLCSSPLSDPPDAPCDVLAELREVLSHYAQLEALDDGWQRLMKALYVGLPQMQSAGARFRDAFPERWISYEHIAVSFVYRYALGAVRDGDLIGKLRLCAVSVLMIRLLDGERFCRQNGAFSFADGVDTAKLYSKEVEYSRKIWTVSPTILRGSRVRNQATQTASDRLF